MENTNNERYAMNVVSRVKRYFVDFFQSQKNYDYVEWQTPKNQRVLVTHLLGKGLAVKTIISLKQNINQFYRFLHEESEGEIDLYKISFTSLKKNIKRKHENERIEKNKHKDRRLSGDDYISNEIFSSMLEHCMKGDPKRRFTKNLQNLVPYLWLSYYYGLRRSEVIAVKEYAELKKGYLRITCQMKSASETMPLKHNHTERKIPHYYIKNLKRTRTMINKIKIIHPSSLTAMWAMLMEEMKLKYTFHNVRNSFCSNLFRDSKGLDISPAHIQLAMGHEDIRTTMKYLRDFRELNDEDDIDDDDFMDLSEAI